MIGKRLKIGDTIGIVSPAGIEKKDIIEKGIKYLRNLGFNIKEGKHVYDRWGYLAGKDENRAADIMDMFLDKEVKMILCVRGGYGAMRLLPFLDFEVIKANPKIFVGYSDITTLLNSFFMKSGLITFHGPMLNSNLENEETGICFFDTLFEGYRNYNIKNPVCIKAESNTKEVVLGRLVGGNLSLICSTLGTPYEIDTKNNILFIEDVGEEPYRIDRMLTQLFLANKLQEAAGIVLGQFTDCKPQKYKKEEDFKLKEVIENRILTLNKPTLINFMSGHEYPKLTLPIGAKVKLDLQNLVINILEPVVD